MVQHNVSGANDGACAALSDGPIPRRAALLQQPLAAAIEAGRSRIDQGIHFQFSNEEGRHESGALCDAALAEVAGSTEFQPITRT